MATKLLPGGSLTSSWTSEASSSYGNFVHDPLNPPGMRHGPFGCRAGTAIKPGPNPWHRASARRRSLAFEDAARPLTSPANYYRQATRFYPGKVPEYYNLGTPLHEGAGYVLQDRKSVV